MVNKEISAQEEELKKSNLTLERKLIHVTHLKETLEEMQEEKIRLQAQHTRLKAQMECAPQERESPQPATPTRLRRLGNATCQILLHWMVLLINFAASGFRTWTA